MSWPLAVALYFVIWWVVLFAVLPLGVRTQDEEGSVVPGTPASAPARPRLLRVVLLTTLLAAVVFAVVIAVFRTGIVTLEPPGVPGR